MSTRREGKGRGRFWGHQGKGPRPTARLALQPLRCKPATRDALAEMPGAWEAGTQRSGGPVLGGQVPNDTGASCHRLWLGRGNDNLGGLLAASLALLPPIFLFSP